MKQASATPESAPWLLPRAAYVHIPFCAHHCGYCDFAVTAGQDHLITLYLEALEMELAALGRAEAVETLFLGGGTPTYLSASQLDRLFRALNEWLPRRGETIECSIESTPDSIDAERIAVLAAAGVNRISIGVQTFTGRLLPTLDRIHDEQQILPAIATARKRIPSISIDLIFGIPGQSLADWQADLETAIRLDVDHISTYGLTYEKGTPLWKQRQRGQVVALDEDLERDMYLLAMDILGAAGYEHYEISNHARQGHRCRHNEIYWANHAYYGFGVGAARYVHGKRQLNVRNTQDYIRRVLSGESPTFQSEELQREERARETIAIQLRRSEGIERGSFLRQTGMDLDMLIGPRIAHLTAIGLMHDDGRRVQLTRAGKCVADAIVEQLL